MAMSQNLKKLIVFSSTSTRTVIENMVKDQAEVERRTESAIIERTLLDKLLPKNESAASWLISLYENGTIGRALYNVFAYLAAGTNWKASETNGRPFVEYLRQLMYDNNSLVTGDEPESYHFISQFESIIDMIKHSNGAEGEKEAEYGRELLAMFRNESQYVILSNYVTFILENWDCLYNYTRTYRALADMATLMDSYISNTPENRCKFADILRKVAAEWK